ncbi:MAG: substrate-binding domain-containing protein [Crocinitomicaceae bacterium]
MSLQKIRIGGVPEHFNLPIHLAKEEGEFERRGVDLEWTDFRGGTGQMTKALRDGEVDMCVLLTEGIVKDIIAGNQSKIISGYVNTPLIWGIHTGIDNQLEHHKQIYDKKYAISRFGSGSHLMAIVDAVENEHVIDTSQFSIIKNLDGALDSLTQKETDVFYWEKYTTKPYVTNGTLKRIGQFVTPWPCFMVAATNKILEEAPDSVIRTLRAIHDRCDQFMQTKDSIALVAKRYNQQPEDVTKWFHKTEWAIHGWISDVMLNNVVHNLREANIIDEDAIIPELVWKR